MNIKPQAGDPDDLLGCGCLGGLMLPVGILCLVACVVSWL